MWCWLQLRILARIFFPHNLWRRICKSQVDRNVEKESDTVSGAESELKQHKLPDAVKKVDVDSWPLESRKSALGLAVKAKLSDMRERIDGLQAALLYESEKRLAGESALRAELLTSMQEVKLAVVGITAAEARRLREAAAVVELCKEAEREVREHRARLNSEVGSIATHSSQRLPIAGSTTAAKGTAIAAKDYAGQTLHSTGIMLGTQLDADAPLQLDVTQKLLEPVMLADASADGFWDWGQLSTNNSSVEAPLRLDVEQRLLEPAMPADVSADGVLDGRHLGANNSIIEAPLELEMSHRLLEPVMLAGGSSDNPFHSDILLHNAVNKLATNHAKVVRLLSDQASRMESLESRISEAPRKPYPLDNSSNSRFTEFIRRFRREAKDTAHATSVASQAVADPRLPATTESQHATSDPLPVAESKGAVDHVFSF